MVRLRKGEYYWQVKIKTFYADFMGLDTGEWMNIPVFSFMPLENAQHMILLSSGILKIVDRQDGLENHASCYCVVADEMVRECKHCKSMFLHTVNNQSRIPK